MPKLRLAVMKDVPTMHRKEGFVSSMVPRSATRYAVMKDVPPMRRMELCAETMEQRERLAVIKDVTTA